MRMISFSALLICTFAVGADRDPTVPKPDSAGIAGRKMLPAYLRAECQKHFDARRRTVAGLKTPEDLKKRQTALREQFVKAIGGFPEKTPLNPKVVGAIDGNGYRIEKVIYESRPDHHVTALLYLPPGKGPFPGVLLPCGHGATGKATDYYQQACMLLAANGMAALCYDPIGQGERFQILGADHKPIIQNTSEHTMLGIGALLVGRSTATYRIWDGIRSLDYLASRPEVDPKRLGCTGVSGGGTLTSYLMALDDRILCAAPSCYITSLERLFDTIGPQDAEQNIPGQVAFGMEQTDYLTMRAPRPTLILCATQDFFDIQGTWTSFREAKRLYGMLGFAERMEIAEFDHKHAYSKPQREQMVRWMSRWLLDKDRVITEQDLPVHKEAELQCTRTGLVLEDFKDKTVVDLNMERDRELAPVRRKAWDEGKVEDRLKEVRRLIALPQEIPIAKRTVVGTMERGKFRIDKVTYETEPGIIVPALEFRRTDRDGKLPAVLYLNGTGKDAEAGPGGRIEQMLAGDSIPHRIIAIDPRGMGATAPVTPPKNRPKYFGVDLAEAFLAFHLNRPLLGQRTYDVLAVLRQVREGSRLVPTLVAEGSACPVALHAAALDPRIDAITLIHPLVSWSDVVRTPVSEDQMTNVVPGALAYYDLPDLARAVFPRPLTIKEAVDATGKPVALADVEKAYTAARAAYQKANAGKELTIK